MLLNGLVQHGVAWTGVCVQLCMHVCMHLYACVACVASPITLMPACLLLLLLLPAYHRLGCCCCLAAAAAAAAWLQAYYELTAAVAFPALALFNLLRFPIVMLPSQVCVWGPLGGGGIVMLPSQPDGERLHHHAVKPDV